MKTLADLNAGLRMQITNLFIQENFCFATVTKNRSPTFYFAKGGLPNLKSAKLCGRLRTHHNKGPLIDITNSPKVHFFFNERKNQREAGEIMRSIEVISGETPNQARALIELLKNKYRATPEKGDFHFEYTNPASAQEFISRRHISGGTIELMPRPTQKQVDLIIGRLLIDQCQIKVDGRTKQRYGIGAQSRPVPALGAYLRSLT